ncbi:MAG: Nif3-like dinuclear metal center hexameric protein [Phycisphaerae bacterium]|nr:Nif3-like dinuclear metal center hexameric protein [Gemmatimonadaceae bacterium]
MTRTDAPPVALTAIVDALDRELRTRDVPDSSVALNGLQVANSGNVTSIAVAVDASLASIRAAAGCGADLLIVHHGLFWAGTQPLVGKNYERVHTLITNNIALYSTHIPLDMHASLGNNVLLAAALELTPNAPFARYKGVDIGVRGSCDEATDVIVQRATAYATSYGGTVRVSVPTRGRRTRHWAICSGMGVSPESLLEARLAGVDTLIVGEGTHHSAVDSAEQDICVVYAGHYATETLGVQALGKWIEQQFGIPWTFLLLPTGL